MECSFVAGKSRNAPIRTVTIPRLELQAAVLAARMDNAFRMELELDIRRVLFWTDSITLNYINNETRRFQLTSRIESQKYMSLQRPTSGDIALGA
jgi:hypothetical protein